MIKQILKYWKMLFSKPVEVRLSSGETVLTYPQRTSNCAARFAQLDMKRIQEMVKGSQNEEKLPAGLKKMMRNSDFYKNIPEGF